MRSCQNCSNLNSWQDLGKIVARSCQYSSQDLAGKQSWQNLAKNLAEILSRKILIRSWQDSCQDLTGMNSCQEFEIGILGNLIVVQLLTY